MCTLCQRIFTAKAKLLSHLTNDHYFDGTEDNLFLCPLCQAKLPTSIGNVQFYFILWQFCTLDGVANLNQNICHRKVTAASSFCDELWTFVSKCDTCVTPYVTLQDTAVTYLWQILWPTRTTIPSVQNVIKTPSSVDFKRHWN